jgi:hypothetical protein
MPTDYIVRLKCPHGDPDQLLMLENREESLKQILETPWNFECPVHGVQREIPLEGSQKSLWSSSRSQRKEAKAVGKAVPQPRSGKRISLHVPVLVSGWSKQESSFLEETATLLVNASGGLLALNSRVALGDTILITNKSTQQEQECLVAYVAGDVHGKLRVGAAFKRPAPHFWGMNRRESRISRKIRVKVRGLDRSGNTFVQNTYAVDISRQGARLEGIGYLTCPGETIQVKRHLQAASFRVVWIGDIGTPQAGHAGLLNLEPNKNIWGVTLSQTFPYGIGKRTL